MSGVGDWPRARQRPAADRGWSGQAPSAGGFGKGSGKSARGSPPPLNAPGGLSTAEAGGGTHSRCLLNCSWVARS